MPRHRSRSRERDRERRRHRRYSSNESHDNDSYYSPLSKRSNIKKKKSDKRNKKERKSKRTRRSPSSSSKSSTENSVTSSKSSKSQTLSDAKRSITDISITIAQKNFNLNLLDDQINSKTLDMLNDDTFQAKTFTSISNKSSKVIIDLQKDTILVPASESTTKFENESIFHPDFLGDESIKVDKWVKKLYAYRKKFYGE